MRTERLTESKTRVIEMTNDEAARLRRLGRSLTSESTWWGAEEEDEETSTRSVIDVARTQGHDRWRVRVKDAIGLVSVGDLQLEVEPKIPLDHLIYLLEQAAAVPRLEESETLAKEDDPFWRLLARWYLAELERLLRRDLVRGYEHHQERLKTLRGRIHPVHAATAYYRGTLDFDCEYEEFKADIPLNRTLRAAARKVASIQTLDRPIRKRGIEGLQRMEEVGDLRPGDLRAKVERNTAHYRNAILLAHHLLGGTDRLPVVGSTYARSFLIPTPKLVEKGILQILQQHLGDRYNIRPRSLALQPSSVTVNLVASHRWCK